jgi:hypothetical protein
VTSYKPEAEAAGREAIRKGTFSFGSRYQKADYDTASWDISKRVL